MVNLLTEIKRKLNLHCDHVYNEEVPETTSTEYIVFHIASGDTVESDRNDLMLEVDIWSRNTNNVAVENLADAVAKELNHYRYYSGGELQACFYLINRLSPPSGEKGLRRRQLRFEVKVYFLS